MSSCARQVKRIVVFIYSRYIYGNQTSVVSGAGYEAGGKGEREDFTICDVYLITYYCFFFTKGKKREGGGGG